MLETKPPFLALMAVSDWSKPMSLTSAYLPSGERTMFIGRLPTLSWVPSGGEGMILPVTRRPDNAFCAKPVIAVNNIAASRHSDPNLRPEKRTLECMGDSPFAVVRGGCWPPRVGAWVDALSCEFYAEVECFATTVTIVVGLFDGSANPELNLRESWLHRSGKSHSTSLPPESS